MAQLTVQEQAGSGYTHKFAFDYLDLQDTNFLSNLGAANQKKIGTMKPGDIIDMAAVYQVTAAAGNTDATLDFGTQTNDPDEIIDAAAIGNLATNPLIINSGDGFATAFAVQDFIENATTANKTLYAEINGTLTALTAGSWVLAWRQLSVPRS